MNTSELIKLVTCIEENVRASHSAGLSFVDSRHQRGRLASKQNHVVFGRRGAGKTSLAMSICETSEFLDIFLNLEDYKDITFPNIILHVLIESFEALNIRMNDSCKWYNIKFLRMYKLKKRLVNVAMMLRNLLHEPDAEKQEVCEQISNNQMSGASVAKYGVGISNSKQHGESKEIKRQIPKNKLEYLRLELTSYKELIDSVSSYFDGKPIFLVMDDFYFIPKEIQPEFIDYFHRLTKGTSLFIKIATIKHRSKLYRRRDSQYIGVELGHDIFEVDMDYSLDNFDELKAFMEQLLNNAISAAKINISVSELFAGDGFSQLCLASGGVPRDFLSLFVTLATKASTDGVAIGKVQVTDAAISCVGNKLESMKKDSGDEDSILIHCLNQIKRYVYAEKRTNAFLIAKDDLENDHHGKQVIRELADLRLIHLVDHNTSKAPSDGRRYEAYIIDIGLYDNSKPRNFNQIDPSQRDDRARKDSLRGSPVFPLIRFTETENNTPASLILPEEEVESTSARQLVDSRESTTYNMKQQLALSYE